MPTKIEKILCPFLNEPLSVPIMAEVFVQFDVYTGDGKTDTSREDEPRAIMCPQYEGNKNCRITGRNCVYAEWKSLR